MASQLANLKAEATKQGKQYGIPDLGALIEAKAAKYGLNPAVLFALVKQESGFNPRIVSPAGAQGLTQLMPGTAQGLGVSDPFDVEQNLEGGARYLAEQLQSFGSYPQALAAYNAGPGAVQQYGDVPPYQETQNYVKAIRANSGQDELFETPTQTRGPGLQSPYEAIKGGKGKDLAGPGPTLTIGGGSSAAASSQPGTEQGNAFTNLIGALIQGFLNFLPGPRGPGNQALGDALKASAQASKDTDTTAQILRAGYAMGSISREEAGKVIDALPTFSQEQKVAIAKQVFGPQFGDAGTYVPSGTAGSPAAGATSGTAAPDFSSMFNTPLMQAQTAEAQARAAEAQANAARLQQETKLAPAREMATSAIAYLTQQIAAGRLTADQAQAELERYKTQTGFEQNRAAEIGKQIGNAQSQTLQALPFQAPPNAQYLPGFEPGGPLARVGQISGFEFNPEQFRAPFTQFNPYNQVLPLANTPVPAVPAAPNILKTALSQGGNNGFDLAMAALNALGQAGQSQAPAALGQAPSGSAPAPGSPGSYGQTPSPGAGGASLQPIPNVLLPAGGAPQGGNISSQPWYLPYMSGAVAPGSVPPDIAGSLGR